MERDTATPAGGLVRGLGLAQATALNVANMVGIGPFITIPQFLECTGGPHALIAWVLALFIVACDGLVWSELGAALPGSGGTYHYLREIFGRHAWGRLVAFLFVWQFLATAALETASGYVGAAGFLTYLVPGLAAPWLGGPFTGENFLAAGAAAVVALALCRSIGSLGRITLVLCAGTLLTVATVIVAGLLHFDARTLGLGESRVVLGWPLILGLAGSMRIAIYDYLGYYNVCHLGDEVRDPGRTIPRAVLLSVAVVAAIYLVMNVAIIGVVPWREAMHSQNVVADFMARIFGGRIAGLFTVLIIWTALAGLFAMTLGYSRIPYAAARNGDFFGVFGRLHPTGRYPHVSLLSFGGLVVACCFLDLQMLVEAAVTIRIPMQFVSQIVALHVLRTSRPDVPLPFRMWLYPIPSLVALAGWVFLLATSSRTQLVVVLLVFLTGCAAFALWSVRGRPGRRPRRDAAGAPPAGSRSSPAASGR